MFYTANPKELVGSRFSIGPPDSYAELEGWPTHDDAAEPCLTRRYPHLNAASLRSRAFTF
jgi:hypothetical protein